MIALASILPFPSIGIEVYFILFFLSIPTFFFWRWLLKKLIHNGKTRRISTWATTIISTPLIYIGMGFLFIYFWLSYPTRNFDQERWSTSKEKRYEFSEDIIKSKMLIGKTKAQVRQILGKENSDQNNNWSYYLGFVPGIGNIDPDVLDIEFKNGVVIKVGQHES